MTSKIKASPILDQYHNDTLKEHKLFLRILLSEERSQRKLRELYEITPPEKKKKRKSIKKKLKKRKKGHQRTGFDYETAKEIVRSEGIMSCIQYKRWHEMNHPARMPKNPARAFKVNWTGWGDFLGVYNEYTRRPGTVSNGRGKFRNLEDAKAFARSLNLTNIEAWRSYTRTGKCPKDIPHRPDLVYGSGQRTEYWLSWKDFLGYSVKSTQDIVEQMSPVVYFGRKINTNTPTNVYVSNVIPGGKIALNDHLSKMNLKIICSYYINSSFDVKVYIQGLSKYPYGGIDEYIIPNIYDIMELFDERMEKVI